MAKEASEWREKTVNEWRQQGAQKASARRDHE
jgi:hypothetical protein